MDDLIAQNMKKTAITCSAEKQAQALCVQVFDFQRLALQVKRFSQR